MAEAFQPVGELEESLLLAPNGRAANLIQLLNRRFETRDDILIVGHEPYLSSLISRLITGAPDTLAIKIKKASICRVTLKDLKQCSRCATLTWLLAPRQLCKLAELS